MQVILKVLSGTHEGKEIKVKDDKFLIGRSESCQLRPKSDSISRKHCAIVQKDGMVLAIDLKSRNGTFVNEKQLSNEKAKILKSGDKLRCGQLEFEVLIEVGIASAKKPEVSTVKEAAVRMTEQTSLDAKESFDISSWLLEADQVDRSKSGSSTVEGDADTRQFTMEDTTRVDATSLVVSPDQAQAAGADEEDGKKKFEKKAPIKLPKATSGPTTKNTKDAASETLKKYFGGR
ncbi:MAG: FHA domain-containing protein [Pirellula sp.]|jgi:predicted component of type VI protein secretion system|nr:FHA domain-containing protein [Pirellula sp.]